MVHSAADRAEREVCTASVKPSPAMYIPCRRPRSPRPPLGGGQESHFAVRSERRPERVAQPGRRACVRGAGGEPDGPIARAACLHRSLAAAGVAVHAARPASSPSLLFFSKATEQLLSSLAISRWGNPEGWGISGANEQLLLPFREPGGTINMHPCFFGKIFQPCLSLGELRTLLSIRHLPSSYYAVFHPLSFLA